MAAAIFQTHSSLPNTELLRTSASTSKIFKSQFGFSENEQARFKLQNFFENNPAVRVNALKGHLNLITSEPASSTQKTNGPVKSDVELFSQMKQRFLSFKKDKYLENLEHFQSLAKAQSPKFMIIACADSRVCPSSVLGIQPGEAFVIRNVANLVPPYDNGPSETNAALEFAVNSLEVENIFVIGHSCCGGIQALMGMSEEENSSSFIRSWVVLGKPAKSITKVAASDLSFDQQCKHCEKESINRSLLSLLTYPWIEEKVMREKLKIHGGYYDFVDCTFEKWTLDYYQTISNKDGKYSLKDREFWR